MSAASGKPRRRRVAPELRLREAFARNGCVRVPRPGRRNRKGRKPYKKGYELRFTADDLRECTEFARLLRRLGIRTGAAFEKRSSYVLPVYGRERVLDAILRLKLRKRTAKKPGH